MDEAVHKTRAGVDWMGNPIFAPIKNAIGYWVRHRQKDGTTTGLFTKTAKREAEQFIGDRASWVVDEFHRLSTHKGNSFGEALVHRARQTLPPLFVNGVNVGGKDELQAFLEPEFHNQNEFIIERFIGTGRDSPIHRDEFAAIQEQRIRLAFRGRPGVYVRMHPDRPAEGYIGHGGDAIDRGIQTNSPHMIVMGFVTLDKKTATGLDEQIHSIINEKGLARRPRPGTRGLVVANCGDIRSMVLDLVPYYRKFFSIIIT